MGRTLYLECYSGISGDMTVAALLDLGADQKVLEKALSSIRADGFRTEITRVKKSGLDACDFSVILDKNHENHDHDMEYLHGHSIEQAHHVHTEEHTHVHDCTETANGHFCTEESDYGKEHAHTEEPGHEEEPFYTEEPDRGMEDLHTEKTAHGHRSFHTGESGHDHGHILSLIHI